MKSLEKAIARFCYKHPRFGIDKLMLYIIAGNIAVYLLSIMDTTGTFLNYLYFSPVHILKGEIWRLITFVFLPSAGSPLFFALSLYFYYFIGSTLEQYWGAGKFTIYYISGVLLTIIFGFVSYACGQRYWFEYIDAFYLNLSLFFAFASLFPETRVLFMFFIPIKIKWLAYIDAIYFVYSLFVNMSIFPVNLLPVIAILNFLIFCAPALLEGIKRRRAYSKSPNAMNFKKAARQAEYEQKVKDYRHKCSVCGKTDVTHPDLDFRYCSRCSGYHCFCSEHINNHVHFTE